MTPEPNAREFAILVRRTGISLSLRERGHAYKAGLLLAKMIVRVGAPAAGELAAGELAAGELEPAAHFDAGEGW